jgi:hypothetical protein
MKILPVEDKVSHEDGETDMKKLTVDFRNFAKASKTYQRPLLIERLLYTVGIVQNT